MHHLLDITLRASFGFVILLALTRILGKKQLGQLTIFTYITSIAMGNIAGDMVVHSDIKLTEGLAGLVIWAFYTFLVEYISLKSSTARVLLDGEPSIVIKKGVIMHKELAAQRLNMDDLTMLLRINSVFSIKEIDYAILEPNGQLSVLKRPEFYPPFKKDLQIKTESRKYIPTEIIVDGQIVEKNLRELNLDRAWLNEQLNKEGMSTPEQVFFAELQADGSLYVSPK